MVPTIDSNVVRRVIDEIWNAGNIDLADELFSPIYVNHGGLIPDLVRGPEGVKFSVALYRAAFPDLHISVDSLSALNGSVQLRWTAQSTFPEARSRTAAAVRARHALTGETRSWLADGQIIESWTSWDSTIALQKVEVFEPTHEETS